MQAPSLSTNGDDTIRRADYSSFKTMIRQNAMKLCLLDVAEGSFGSFLWFHLAWRDLKQRYRRSLIGPFWLTLSTAIMLLAMGPLYGKLFNRDLGPYFQYISVSFVSWILISGYIGESCTIFINAENLIKSIKLPHTTYILRVLAKHVMIYGHNIIFTLAVLLFFPPEHIGAMTLIFPGLLLVLVNLFWIGLLIAILCTRFRDVTQIVQSLVQVLFFLTPVMWENNMLGKHAHLMNWNYLFHLLEIVREPMLGRYPSQLSWYVALIGAATGTAITLVIFSKFRSRISYWV